MNQVARFAVCLALLMAVEHAAAQPWEFGPIVDVAQARGDGIFHHLESSGRRSIAVSGATIAVAWEDDHDGVPRVYLARKDFDSGQFQETTRISGSEEAYEPSIISLPGDRFVIAWEEGGRVHARLAVPQRLGPVARLADGEAAQANLSIHGNRVYALRSQSEGRFSRIRLQVLHVDSTLALVSETDCAVDPPPLADDQFYPASAATGDELIVAWEDRRRGHTIIMASAAKLDNVCAFQPPVRISESRAEPKSAYGKGHGVARVALAGVGESRLVAVWADKRNYWEGYDIYAAAYLGNAKFGANTRVQDEFGDFARQWHAAIAGNAAGRLTVAWTDEREGDSDVMLSWLEEGGWSEDLPLPGASGAGHQTHPSIAMDAAGNLHAAWIERAQVNGPTRLRYQLGRTTED